MLPLNPQKLMNFSSDDVDVILAALHNFVDTDFSAIWNRKRCREDRRIAEQIIRKFENRATDIHASEIKLIYVALCFFLDYLDELNANDELTEEQKQLAPLVTYMTERFATIMEHFGIVNPDND